MFFSSSAFCLCNKYIPLPQSCHAFGHLKKCVITIIICTREKTDCFLFPDFPFSKWNIPSFTSVFLYVILGTLSEAIHSVVWGKEDEIIG